MNVDDPIAGSVSVPVVIRCLDLSEEGALFLLDLPLALGSIHQFSVALEEEILSLRAVVRHCQPVETGYRMGVQFVDLDPESARRLRDALAGMRRGAASL